jgi:malonyl CoA-acyl carrier protein transacylase
MITYLFPGQGSQTKGMGKQLFARFPEETETASDILGYSIVSLCTEDPNSQLNQTQFTQPALFVVNALSYKLRLAESGELPDFLAGHSLGEYNALHSSGAFSFEDGIRLVARRGKLMSQAPSGVMAAVIGLSVHDIQATLDFHGLSAVYIANYNSPNQTIVSGIGTDIEKSRQVLVDKGANFVRLNTSGAFHSPYMVSAREEFARYLENFSFSKLKIPVVSNVTARPYRQEEIATQLAAHITNPVRWSESISYLLQQGEMQFEELGVGNILTKLIPSIKREYQAQQRDTPKVSQSQHDNRIEPPLASRFGLKNVRTDVEGSSQFETQFTMDKEKLAANARNKVEQWNSLYPVGTKVRVPGYDKELKTNSPAVILFRYRAAVYMEDYNGYFALDEISPAER